MNYDYDTIVIGAGNAGLAAAGKVHQAGKRVAIIERAEIGGTCPIRGCVPKKVLVAAAQTMDQINRADVHHIHVDNAAMDWSKLVAREQSFVEGVPEQFASSLKSRGLEVLAGEATFVSTNAIEVSGRELSAESFVIASGSVPRPISVTGGDLLMTSDDLLRMETLPESIVFVGGGVIALEFSHVLVRVGVKVTILEMAPRLLPRIDADAVQALHKESERLGIAIQTNANVERIVRKNDSTTLTFSVNGEQQTITASQAVNGTGRIADLELNLGAADVNVIEGRIEVNPFLQSVSNSSVYVAGDALWSSPQLSPVASYEGRIVGDNIVDGLQHKPDYRGIPANVYTIPALASVGISEEEARQQGFDVDVRINDLVQWRSSRSYAETAAFSKVILDRRTDQILGAFLLGHGGEESIHLLSLAIRHELPAQALRDMVYGYPTFMSDIPHML